MQGLGDTRLAAALAFAHAGTHWPAEDAEKVGHINALRNYWKSFYEIRQLTLFDFIKNEPLVITEE